MSDEVLALLPTAFITDAGWARINCPFCADETGKEDKRQSLSVAIDSGYYSCWKCETKGFVDVDGIPLQPRRRTYGRVEPKVIVPPPNFVPLSNPSAVYARQYLKARELDLEICESAGVGTCSRGGYSNRVIVPIIKPDDQWGGWVARLWCKPAADGWDSIRYLYPKGMDRGNLLYNERAVYDESATTPLIVVEGVFDALRHWPNAVAVLGKPTDGHLNILRRTNRSIAVVMDPDARKKGWALTMQLRLYRKHAVQVHLQSGTDPAETPPEILNRLIDQAFKKVA